MYFLRLPGSFTSFTSYHQGRHTKSFLFEVGGGVMYLLRPPRLSISFTKYLQGRPVTSELRRCVKVEVVVLGSRP